MTEVNAELRIRRLRRRVEMDSTSPLFVGLAEEYRMAGHLPEAIRTLEKGLQTHPRYVSAQVALARAYLEADRTEEAVAMFSKALACDPGNMVSARSLADIYYSRGQLVEAIKKYKLYRALAGDHGVDEIIDRIEKELGSAPEAPAEPRGRVLADLYFAQGHYADALALYREIASSDPSDPELARLTADAAARLSAAGGGSPARSPEGRRAAKVQALKRWLSVIQRA